MGAYSSALSSGSALDAVEAALRVVLVSAAPPEDQGLLSRLVEQATCTRARSPVVPQPDGSQAGGHDPAFLPFAVPPQPCAGVPSLAVLHDRVVASAHAAAGRIAAGLKPTSSGPAAVLAKSLSSGSISAAPSHDTTSAAEVHAAMAHVHAERLASEACRLAVCLGATGSCLLVGPPGSGKTLLWKALVAAASGPDVLHATERRSHHDMACPRLLHLYPQTQPVAGPLGGGSGSDRDDPGSHLHAALAHLLLPPSGNDPLPAMSQQLRRDHPSALTARGSALAALSGEDSTGWQGQLGGGDARQQASSAPTASPVGEQPEWLVLDGPLGSAAAEAVVPLLARRCRQYSSRDGGQQHRGASTQQFMQVRDALGRRRPAARDWKQRHVMRCACAAAQVLGVGQQTKVLWECSSLEGASPALLAAVPVVSLAPDHLHDPAKALHTAAAWAAQRALPQPCAQGDADRVARSVSGLLVAVMRQAHAALAVVPGSGTASPFGPDSTSQGTSDQHKQPPAAPAGTSAFALAQQGVPKLLPPEHGGVLFTTALQTAAALLREACAAFEPAGSEAEARLRLARAALFACHWALAPLPVDAAVRAALGEAGQRAAEECGLEDALPDPGAGGLHGHMLDPRHGTWCAWPAALGPLVGAHHSLEQPNFSK